MRRKPHSRASKQEEIDISGGNQPHPDFYRFLAARGGPWLGSLAERAALSQLAVAPSRASERSLERRWRQSAQEMEQRARMRRCAVLVREANVPLAFWQCADKTYPDLRFNFCFAIFQKLSCRLSFIRLETDGRPLHSREFPCALYRGKIKLNWEEETLAKNLLWIYVLTWYNELRIRDLCKNKNGSWWNDDFQRLTFVEITKRWYLDKKRKLYLKMLQWIEHTK